MKSIRLEKNGVQNFIAGSEYNFRYQKIGKGIVQNIEKVLQVMDISPLEIYSGQQVHSANVAYVDGVNGEPFVFGKTVANTDGLITDKPNIALMIKFADCTPIVLYDPVKKVLACIHSGWRGTVQRISGKTIEKMESDWGCKREDITVYVGPSIDQDNYEVGREVYDAFHNFKTREYFFQSGKNEGKYLLSMTAANVESLKEAGIRQENIEVERASTFTDNRLHSARKEGKEYQLNGILTMMMD